MSKKYLSRTSKKVIPANAGIQLMSRDPRFRGDDVRKRVLFQRFLPIFLLIASFFISSFAYGDDCLVTESRGTGVGTLKRAVMRCTSTITFDVDQVYLEDTIKFLRPGISLVGPRDVVINGDFDGPVFQVLTPSITIKDIAISNSGPVCLELLSNGARVEGVIFDSCESGVIVSGSFAVSNLITESRFIDVDNPIVLRGGGNLGLDSPTFFEAFWIDLDYWLLSGERLFPTVVAVDIYKEDEDILDYVDSVVRGDIDVEGSSFDIDVDWSDLPPGFGYRLLFHDRFNNTSEMSEYFFPRGDLSNGLPEGMEACLEADWFWEEGIDNLRDDACGDFLRGEDDPGGGDGPGGDDPGGDDPGGTVDPGNGDPANDDPAGSGDDPDTGGAVDPNPDSGTPDGTIDIGSDGGSGTDEEAYNFSGGCSLMSPPASPRKPTQGKKLAKRLLGLRGGRGEIRWHQ